MGFRNYPPRKVYSFPTRDDLERYQYVRKNRKSLAGELINAKIAGREYQIQAIRSVMEAIQKRKGLKPVNQSSLLSLMLSKQ